MKENGRKGSSGETATHRLSITDVMLYSVWSGGFYSQPIVQFTKNYKNKYYYKEKVGRKPKREQKAKTGSMKEQGRINSGKSCEQCCRNQISQCFIFLLFSASLSFLRLICNAEFNSNSSCLDRLNNFGIISFSKTVKLATKCDQ